MQRVLTAWHPGEGNAGDFYKKFGFIETGEKIDNEILAELTLPRHDNLGVSGFRTSEG
jgi:hypothetical protein